MNTEIFTRQGKYLMLALDHRGSFRKMINPENPDSVTEDQGIELKARIMRPLADYFSGILIDPAYGLSALRLVYPEQSRGFRGKPFLLSLEESGYEEKEGDRYSRLQYKAAQLKEWGASGAKLLLYFDAAGKSAEHQMDIARQAWEDAHSKNLPLFLEIVTYGKDREEHGAGQATLSAMKMLLDKGVKPDVWKLEFPGSADLAKRVTERAGNTPWILLTRGASFEDFKKELQTSVENGAVGFLAGRAVWQEVMDFQGPDQEKFLSETVPQRFREISQLALSS